MQKLKRSQQWRRIAYRDGSKQKKQTEVLSKITGNRCNITIFSSFSLPQQFTNMQLVSQRPFEIVAIGGAKTEYPAKGLQWPKQDLIKYAVFVVFHVKLQDVNEELDFNSWSFFRKLSIFVQSKNPNQCRIHHKKMMIHHSSIDSLSSHLRSTIHKFEEWFSFYEAALTNLRTCLLREKKEIQKQHTLSHRITLNINSEEQKGGLEEFDKKEEDFKPTDVGYGEEDVVHKPSLFFNKASRPSFSLSEDICDGADDMTFLSKRSTLERKPLMGDVEKWKDCQNSFMNYIGRLNTLVNSSVSDY